MDVENLTPSISEAHLGLILQRGGQELGLKKVEDRFTVCLTSPNAHLPSQILTFAHRQIPCKDGEGKALLFEEVTVDPEDLDSAMMIARACEGIAFVSHVYQVKDNPETIIYLTNQITIQFYSHVSQAQITTIINDFQLELIKPLTGINNTFIYQLSKQSSQNPIKIANFLMSLSEVITAEANVISGRESLSYPQDSFFPLQWYLQHRGGKELAVNSHIKIEGAWALTKGDRSVIIAIADDGFDLQHPDFQGAGKIVHPKDFADQDFWPLPDQHQESHGTACAGIVLAEENGRGIMGVAPRCAFMPLRTNGYLDDQSIEDLFNYALEKGASVLSCSWGVAAAKFPLSLRQNLALHRLATQGRGGKGCVVVFAAGNANRPINGTIYERGWEGNLLKGRIQWLNGFATHPDAIAVSACTSLNKKAAYSNWGEEISVCAPSNNGKPMMWFEQTGLIPTAPEITANLRGLGVFTTDQLGKLGYDPGNFTHDFGGTSGACAIVAGLAGLILTINPDLTAQEVKEILQESADKIIDLDPDPQLGMRMGTYNNHGHSLWFGYGKVNAQKAVEIAQQRLKKELITRLITNKNETKLSIPDDEPTGILSQILITENGTIKDVKIRVKIDHEFLGDLEISLRSPQDQIVLLQNRSLGTKTSLDQEYNLANTPSLKQLLKQPIEGIWYLWIVDYAKEDRGILKYWELEFKI